jgi:hypothetical protein
MPQQRPVEQGLLIIEDLRSHSEALQSVGLLWMSDQPVLYLTTLITHKRQTSMSPAGFEPAIPASERPQIHALDREATGIGTSRINRLYKRYNKDQSYNQLIGIKERKTLNAEVMDLLLNTVLLMY